MQYELHLLLRRAGRVRRAGPEHASRRGADVRRPAAVWGRYGRPGDAGVPGWRAARQPRGPAPATEYAARRAADAGVLVAFALTTNGTLLDSSDADFFDRYEFDVTISIDGTRKAHNRLRLLLSGEGSYERVIEHARLLVNRPGRSYTIRARASVTPANLAIRETLDELIRLGFDGVHLAPVLHSPTGAGEMSIADLTVLLERMIECALVFEQKVIAGESYPFQNVVSTLRRIHGYARDTYPCGAGGGYMGVSSTGDLFGCHRFVDDEAGAMGTVEAGIDAQMQAEWLARRHVLAQEPCRTCWARHLCGGGCHHEAIHRGRPACDFIRGWLHHCLGAYVRLLKAARGGSRPGAGRRPSRRRVTPCPHSPAQTTTCAWSGAGRPARRSPAGSRRSATPSHWLRRPSTRGRTSVSLSRLRSYLCSISSGLERQSRRLSLSARTARSSGGPSRSR